MSLGFQPRVGQQRSEPLVCYLTANPLPKPLLAKGTIWGNLEAVNEISRLRGCPVSESSQSSRKSLLLSLLLVGITAGVVYAWLNPYPDFLVSPDESQNLLVFVGKKIDVEEVSAPSGSLDHQYTARYQVLQIVHGQYPNSEIEFTAFDHYGHPGFRRYETALIYVTMGRSWLLQPKYFHEKYQYQPVYPTADGRWAGCGDPYQAEYEGHRKGIQTQAITFKPEVVIDITKIEPSRVETLYPKAFFDYRQDAVVCRKGVFLDELFAVKREGVLKARGIFK
jgi:hypothetical protein